MPELTLSALVALVVVLGVAVVSFGLGWVVRALREVDDSPLESRDGSGAAEREVRTARSELAEVQVLVAQAQSELVEARREIDECRAARLALKKSIEEAAGSGGVGDVRGAAGDGPSPSANSGGDSRSGDRD